MSAEGRRAHAGPPSIAIPSTSFTYEPACVRMWWRSLPMLMKRNPFSRNSLTRDVPNRKIPRMTSFFCAAAISRSVASPSSGDV
jgi:hypothetical protein